MYAVNSGKDITMDSNEKEILNNEESVENEEVVNDIEDTAEKEEAVNDMEVINEADEVFSDVSDEQGTDEILDEIQDYDAESEETSELDNSDYETVTELENAVQTDEEQQTKKKSAAPVIAVIAVLVIAIAVAAYAVFSDGIGGNKYNNMGYVNVSGRTVQDIADSAGIELQDFLTEYSLPADMPGDTYEIAAIYNMPAKIYLQTMMGIDFATVKTELNIPDETTPNTPKSFTDKIKSIFVKDEIQPIDENTPWYIVEGEMTVGDYSGGDMESFKTFYGLGDEVTEATKIKEIRDQINKKTAEMLEEQNAAQNNAGEENPEQSPEADTPENSEQPAEGEAANNAE